MNSVIILLCVCIIIKILLEFDKNSKFKDVKNNSQGYMGEIEVRAKCKFTIKNIE